MVGLKGWDSGQARLDVLALEPCCGGSRERFLRGLASVSNHRFASFTLPGGHGGWRTQSGALSLADQVGVAFRSAEATPDAAEMKSPQTEAEVRPVGEAFATARLRFSLPDVLFVSDTLDLPTFLSLVGPEVARAPSVLYLHDNQLTHPLPPGGERDWTCAMRNIVSALAAHRVLFNSHHQRGEFLSAARGLLADMRGEVPGGVIDEIERKTAVLPGGCDLRRFDAQREKALREAADGRWGDPARGPLLLWNQRWEYDKAPEKLFAALSALREQGVPFRLAMAGPGRGTPTRAFVQAKEGLAHHIVQWGYVEGDADYAALLWASDVLASTAIHEPFGVAAVEAIYCGCRPVLPWGLGYPEVAPAEAHEDVLYREGEVVTALARALAEPRAWSEDWQRTWVARFDWASIGGRFDDEMRRCWRADLAGRARAMGSRWR